MEIMPQLCHGSMVMISKSANVKFSPLANVVDNVDEAAAEAVVGTG